MDLKDYGVSYMYNLRVSAESDRHTYVQVSWGIVTVCTAAVSSYEGELGEGGTRPSVR